MQLPVGVYAVSQCFDGTEGAVEFTFQGVSYEAQVGVNAFPYLENLCDVALQAVQASFCGYENMPVVLMPAGLYKAGTIKETRFRTYLPRAMAILGENAGLSPNGPDLRSEGQRGAAPGGNRDQRLLLFRLHCPAGPGGGYADFGRSVPGDPEGL